MELDCDAMRAMLTLPGPLIISPLTAHPSDPCLSFPLPFNLSSPPPAALFPIAPLHPPLLSPRTTPLHTMASSTRKRKQDAGEEEEFQELPELGSDEEEEEYVPSSATSRACGDTS